MEMHMELWREDIRLLEAAAKLSCGRCAVQMPLFDQVSHVVSAGVKVFCEAAGINAFMAQRIAVTREQLNSLVG